MSYRAYRAHAGISDRAHRARGGTGGHVPTGTPNKTRMWKGKYTPVEGEKPPLELSDVVWKGVQAVEAADRAAERAERRS